MKNLERLSLVAVWMAVFLWAIVVFDILFPDTPIANSTNGNAYTFGIDCRHQGVPADANPYQRGSELAEHWLRGWVFGLSPEPERKP